MKLLNQIPLWYLIIGFIWSIYQGVRGAIEHRLNYEEKLQNRSDKEEVFKMLIWEKWERWIVLYLHDFVFRFVCTISGFISLYLAYALYNNNLNGANPGILVFIAFLVIVGIIGVGGQLHYIILMGKLPKY